MMIKINKKMLGMIMMNMKLKMNVMRTNPVMKKISKMMIQTTMMISNK